MRARLLVLLSVIGTSARAEVADKVPSVAEYVTWAVGFIVVAFVLTRWKWWLGFAVAALAFTWDCFVAFGVLLDPFVGPAIAAEAGQTYVLAAWLSLGAGVVAPLLVGLWGRRRRLSAAARP